MVALVRKAENALNLAPTSQALITFIFFKLHRGPYFLSQLTNLRLAINVEFGCRV
jgi:hypothetical protein